MLPALFSIALLGIAVVIIAEGGLALLGVGVPPPPDPSWGNIIAQGRGGPPARRPSSSLIPSTVIFLTVLSLNFLGDKIRDRFDVRESVLVSTSRTRYPSCLEEGRRSPPHQPPKPRFCSRSRTLSHDVHVRPGVRAGRRQRLSDLDRGRRSASWASRARASPCWPARSWASCRSAPPPHRSAASSRAWTRAWAGAAPGHVGRGDRHGVPGPHDVAEPGDADRRRRSPSRCTVTPTSPKPAKETALGAPPPVGIPEAERRLRQYPHGSRAACASGS